MKTEASLRPRSLRPRSLRPRSLRPRSLCPRFVRWTRAFAALLALAMVVALAACGAPEPTAVVEATPATPAPPSATPVPPTSTPVPPTQTPVPPTPTPAPTETPLPEPPTETPMPEPPTPVPGPPGWTQKADLSDARVGAAAEVVDGTIYLLGGWGELKEVAAYDPAADIWTEKASMPGKRQSSGAGVVNGRIYVIGGAQVKTMSDGADFYESLALVHEYDPATDTWTKKASLQEPRDAPSVAVANGKIYAIGGALWDPVSGAVKGLSSVEEYDPATDTWLPMASMPGPKTRAAAVSVNDKIYALGGMTHPEKGVTGSMYEYDPKIDAWSEKAAMPTRRTWASVVVDNGLIYVFGGAENHHEPASSSVFVYDPAADSWAEREDMPFERWGMAAGLVDGKVYLIGGSQSPDPFKPFSAEVWAYDLEVGE